MTDNTELITREQVAEILLHGGDLDIISSADIQTDMVRRILASENVAEAFAEFTTVPAKDLDGQKVTIHGVKWAKSGFQEGPGVYALLDVTTNGDDEHLVVSMGGRSLMAALYYTDKIDGYPIEGVPRLKPSKSNPDKSFWTFKLA